MVMGVMIKVITMHTSTGINNNKANQLDNGRTTTAAALTGAFLRSVKMRGNARLTVYVSRSEGRGYRPKFNKLFCVAGLRRYLRNAIKSGPAGHHVSYNTQPLFPTTDIVKRHMPHVTGNIVMQPLLATVTAAAVAKHSKLALQEGNGSAMCNAKVWLTRFCSSGHILTDNNEGQGGNWPCVGTRLIQDAHT
jgi:hypothetical protein